MSSTPSERDPDSGSGSIDRWPAHHTAEHADAPAVSTTPGPGPLVEPNGTIRALPRSRDVVEADIRAALNGPSVGSGSPDPTGVTSLGEATTRTERADAPQAPPRSAEAAADHTPKSEPGAPGGRHMDESHDETGGHEQEQGRERPSPTLHRRIAMDPLTAPLSEVEGYDAPEEAAGFGGLPEPGDEPSHDAPESPDITPAADPDAPDIADAESAQDQTQDPSSPPSPAQDPSPDVASTPEAESAPTPPPAPGAGTVDVFAALRDTETPEPAPSTPESVPPFTSGRHDADSVVFSPLHERLSTGGPTAPENPTAGSPVAGARSPGSATVPTDASAPSEESSVLDRLRRSQGTPTPAPASASDRTTPAQAPDTEPAPGTAETSPIAAAGPSPQTPVREQSQDPVEEPRPQSDRPAGGASTQGAPAPSAAPAPGLAPSAGTASPKEHMKPRPSSGSEPSPITQLSAMFEPRWDSDDTDPADQPDPVDAVAPTPALGLDVGRRPTWSTSGPTARTQDGSTSGPAPAERIEFASRRATPLVLLVLLLAAFAGFCLAAWTAWQGPTTTTITVAAVLGVITLVIWGARSRGAAAKVVVEHGVLTITGHETRHIFDLNTSYTPIEAVGTPGRRGWKVLITRRSMEPFVIDDSMVDPHKFMKVLDHYRPTRGSA